MSPFSGNEHDVGTQRIEYEWGGGLGAVFKSYERGVKRGDVRYIRGHLFYVYSVHHMDGIGQWLNPYKEIWWTFAASDDGMEAVRAFKAKVVGC